jgi:septum formation protein
MFTTLHPLILASASPRRRDLLRQLGLGFDIIPARNPEPWFRAGDDPLDFARQTARAKAEEVAGRHDQAAVLAADTVVVVEGEVLGKPGDEAEARQMLTRLAGREHEVITGCCLCWGQADVHSVFEARTRVWMEDFGPDVIAAYAATGEPLDKAGAYGIQERAGFLVRRIQGSYSNVVGLPLAETVELLLAHGLIRPGEQAGPNSEHAAVPA